MIAQLSITISVLLNFSVTEFWSQMPNAGVLIYFKTPASMVNEIRFSKVEISFDKSELPWSDQINAGGLKHQANLKWLRDSHYNVMTSARLGNHNLAVRKIGDLSLFIGGRTDPKTNIFHPAIDVKFELENLPDDYLPIVIVKRPVTKK